MSQNLPWGDRPEAKPFLAQVNGEGRELDIGNCAIALFRRRAYMDYLAVRTEEDEGWVFCFDQQELVYWMAGFALQAYDRENIRRAEGKLGSFVSRYGWNPDVVVEDYPTANEIEVYLEYVTRDADHPEVLLNTPPEEDGA